MLIDTHCHIDIYKNEEIKQIVERAKKANVKTIINAGVNPETNRRSIELSKKYPEIKSALGIYPIDALKLSDKKIEEEIKFIKKNKNKILAIGEVGIDLKENSKKETQIKNFQKFIKLSKELNKPIIVHSRKAEPECIEILEKSKFKKIQMHCFSGNKKLIQRIIDNGWFLSIPTTVKNSEHFQLMIKMTPIEQLLCETDSPFLHPNKERNNEPANIIESYKKIAEIKNLTLKEVEKQVENNFKILFR